MYHTQYKACKEEWFNCNTIWITVIPLCSIDIELLNNIDFNQIKKKNCKIISKFSLISLYLKIKSIFVLWNLIEN